MSQLMDQYIQWLKSLETRRKSLLEALKEYEPLKELLRDIEGDILKAKEKIKAIEGKREPSLRGLFAHNESLPYTGMKIAEAAQKYLSNGASDRTMKGIAKSLITGGLAKSNPNSIQAVINKMKAPNGPFVKKGNEWFIEK